MGLTFAAHENTERRTCTCAPALREGGEQVAPAAFATGERIKVVFEEQPGKNLAKSFEISGTATPATPGKSK